MFLLFSSLSAYAQCPERLVAEMISDTAPLFAVDPSSLSFLSHELFRERIFQRANGNEGEMRSLIFASILNYVENPMATFEEGQLFFGSEINAMDADTIGRQGITRILNLAGSYSGEFLKDDQSIIYKSMTIEDTPEAVLPIEEAVSFIEESIRAGEKILVHCIEGKSRSGSILIAYFIKKYGWDYHQALNHLSKQRRAVPNEGFLQQLLNYQIANEQFS